MHTYSFCYVLLLFIRESKVFIPPKYFERVSQNTSTESDKSELYRCLMGCPLKYGKDGQPKNLRVSNKSMFAATRHIEVTCEHIFSHITIIDSAHCHCRIITKSC